VRCASAITLQLVRGDREALLVSVEVATEELSPLAPVAIIQQTGRRSRGLRVASTATEAQVQRAVAGKLAELAHIASERAAGHRPDHDERADGGLAGDGAVAAGSQPARSAQDGAAPARRRDRAR